MTQAIPRFERIFKTYIMKTRKTTTSQNWMKRISFITFAVSLFIGTSAVQAQNEERIVSGVVNSVDGPIMGATVVLKGTTIAIPTNASGEFVFPKPLKEKDVLVVSYLGYENVEVTIGAETTYVEPIFKDNPIVIYGALRVLDASEATKNNP